MVGKTEGMLAGLVAIVAAMSPAQATTPDQSWRGIERLAILAHLTGPTDPAVPSDGFCERVRQIATQGAPFPVRCIAFGEGPAAEADGTLIVVQGAIQSIEGERLLVVAARRTAAAGLEPGPIYLGATPRAARLSGAAAGAAADTALREALGEILPWLGHDG